MSSRSLSLSQTLQDYVSAVGVRPDPLLERLRAETATLEWGRMQISAEQGALMDLLLRLMGARQAIEVGTFTGYSALVTARALGPTGRLVACDINPETTAIARRYWAEAGLADRIDLRLAPALDTLDGLLADGGEGRFDFAFVDADKPAYGAYYERLLRLIRPGGLIAVDNTLWSGKVADPSENEPSTVALRAFNRMLHGDSRVEMALIPIGDGLSLARKR